jgi:hypothetical protein
VSAAEPISADRLRNARGFAAIRTRVREALVHHAVGVRVNVVTFAPIFWSISFVYVDLRLSLAPPA